MLAGWLLPVSDVGAVLLASLSSQPEKIWLERLVEAFTRWFPPYSFLGVYSNVMALIAVILVSLICGAVGSLVVGNRMAFFSDALAHCTFAGVALGFLLVYFGKLLSHGNFYEWATPVMVGFGILVGIGIAYVREKTSLASDTVIGVFFAGAIGFGAMLLQGVARLGRYFNPEDFLFGDPLTANVYDVLVLLVLFVLTASVLMIMYNRMIFASLNPSLARSRRISVRLCSYLFIILLALIVNLCLKTVGALLINALLIVPAATAANVCRNLRQLFWLTICLCFGVSIAGYLLSFYVQIPLEGRQTLSFGSGGTIVVLSVALFFLSMFIGPCRRWLEQRRLSAAMLEEHSCKNPTAP